MMHDCSQGVMKINRFAQILAGGERDTLRTRMEIIDRGRSVSRIMPIDAENEEFSYIERSFTGVNEMIERRQSMVAGAVAWPQTVLFGRSPAGLSATGESDVRGWYDGIQSDRASKYQPLIEQLLRIVAASIGIEEPAALSISWPSLWQESPKERAERQKLVADADAIYLAQDAVMPDEIATARWGDGEWSDRAPTIDTEAREAMREQDSERAASLQEQLKTQGELEKRTFEPAAEPEVETPPEAVSPQSALNGAQVTALLEVVQQVVAGMLPRESAVEIIISAFPVDRSTAERILGTVGAGFVASSPQSEPAAEPGPETPPEEPEEPEE